MKKSVLLTMTLLALSLQNFANMRMTGWSWRYDDNDLDGASFMMPLDGTPVTITDPTQNIRLRVRLDNEYSDSKSTYSLYYSPLLPKDSTNGNATALSSNGNFYEVGPDSFFDWAPSAYVSSGTTTSSMNISFNSLISAIYQSTFSPGEFTSANINLNCKPLSYTEIEYCIKPTANIIPGTYYFIGGNVEVMYGYNACETLATLSYQGTTIKPTKSTKFISTDSIKTAIGNTLTLPIKTANLTAFDSVIAYQFEVNYDPTALKFSSYSTFGTLSQNGTIMVNSSEIGKLKIGYASSTPLIGSGALVNLNFNALKTGRTKPIISNFLFNTDSVKNISTSPIDSYTINLGDIDENSSIQAYDGALVLQYSAGLSPLPSVDPLPWADWRVLAADVDGNGNVTAYDAALILQKSINLISSFPVNSLLNTASDNAYINIEQDGDNLLFKAYGNPIGLNVTTSSNLNILGEPIFSKGGLTTTNISNNRYSVGLAIPYAPKDGTTLLTIPIKDKSVNIISFDVTVNNNKSTVYVNYVTGIADVKSYKATISPNPATDFIHISNIKAGSVLTLYDLTGRKLKEKMAASTTESMSIENLKAGFYNLVITNEKEKAVTKFIKK